MMQSPITEAVIPPREFYFVGHERSIGNAASTRPTWRLDGKEVPTPTDIPSQIDISYHIQDHANAQKVVRSGS
ncbi:hypothetical protein K443DRAFT_671316 [Laccaria amethystina LaAM-08-1]|jgi:hypothetical protein|uniref:Uncharacterized protein n=1 Tax=Laccaria amethystina LaAM-08-1 TaxID=1095629 RepID=A0A0C9YG80_9AGAR|nr:hypothetical protein K443DRAFT_671316 [Laccaria amethystina LaAM-08-1]